MNDVAAELFARGQAAWPALTVDQDVFVAHVRRVLGDLPREALDQIHAGDLFLAVACVAGVPAALRELETRHLRRVPDLVRKLDPSPAFADEVRQMLAEKLLVSEPDAPARLATYAGRGPLAAWFAIAAQRTAVDLLRKDRREMTLEGDLAASLSASDGADAALLRERYRSQFEDGLRRGLARLSARDRTILRLNLIAGVSLRTIATSYGVDQSTVTRWMAAARDLLLTELERHMEADLPKTELASIVRLVRSQVDLALSSSGAWLSDGGG